MASIGLSRVTKSFQGTTVLDGIDLAVADGEFVVFVGPSGCGKSTLLRLICGLDTVSSGLISIDGEAVNDVPPAKRGIAMVFQSYALYPHMTVAQNMGYALRLAGTPAAEIASRVQRASEVLQLESLLARKPRQLSGGQRQRVAIGRAIVREPRIFLFDEPLSNLDAALRVDMRAEIAALKARLGTTMVYVTHDQTEAMTLADRIVVLNGGRVEQIGTPLELYRVPANLFVAGFIGSPRMNLLPGDLAGMPGGSRVGVRPEHLRAVPDGQGQLAGVAEVVEHLGSDAFVHVRVGSTDRVVVRVPGHVGARAGDRLGLSYDPTDVHVFGTDGRRVGGGGLARSAA